MCPVLICFMQQATHAHIDNPVPKNIQVVSSGFIVLKITRLTRMLAGVKKGGFREEEIRVDLIKIYQMRV